MNTHSCIAGACSHCRAPVFCTICHGDLCARLDELQFSSAFKHLPKFEPPEGTVEIDLLAKRPPSERSEAVTDRPPAPDQEDWQELYSVFCQLSERDRDLVKQRAMRLLAAQRGSSSEQRAVILELVAELKAIAEE